jgi:hypothetical protein
VSSDYDANSHPAVQAAYAAYLDAWIDVANLPGLSERSASQAAAAQEAKFRLYEADKAHYEAWHAASREANPELYREGAGPRRHDDRPLAGQVPAAQHGPGGAHPI